MSLLSSLKFISAQQKVAMSPALHRRSNLSKKIIEQIEMATAQLEGRTYTATKSKFVKNEDGQRVATESTKKLKAWWWKTTTGKFNLNVRYGAKIIDLSKGKNAVEVADLQAVVDTLKLINEAVNGGELDAAIEAVSGAGRKTAK